MFIAAAIALIALAFIVPLMVRSTDLPQAPKPSPTLHLEERRVTIYESLRDLQNEFRMGKLSDEDYQSTKQDLQDELAEVMARIAPATSAAIVSCSPARFSRRAARRSAW